MIDKCKQKDGSAGGPINYILGGKSEKDQIVTVVDYNGFALSNKMIREIEAVPGTPEEKRFHKKEIWKITQRVAAVFDGRASVADYRVKRCNEEYIIGYSPDDMEKLTVEFRRKIVREFLEGMGVHGDVDVKRTRHGKEIHETLHREALYLACSHDGTNAPHDHVFTSRIAMDGKANDTRNERLRSLKVCRALSKKYGLALRLNGEEVTEENGYTISMSSYVVDEKKANTGYVHKLHLTEAIKACLRDSTTMDDFKAGLKKAGIDVTLRVHEDTGEEYGILFSSKDAEGFNHTYSGTQLDRSLSFGRIKATIMATASKKDAARYKEIWNFKYAPLYSRAVEVSASAYNCHMKYKEQLGEVGQELSEQFANMRELRDRSRWLSAAINSAPTGEAVLAAVCVAVGFVNPLLAIAAKVIGSSLIIIGQRYNLARRREICEDLANVWSEIDSLRAEQASLREKDRAILSKYKESRDEKNSFKKALEDARKGLAMQKKEVFSIKFIVHSATSANIFCNPECLRDDQTYRYAARHAKHELEARGYSVNVSQESDYEGILKADGTCYRTGHVDVSWETDRGTAVNFKVEYNIDAVVGRPDATEPLQKMGYWEKGMAFLKYTANGAEADHERIFKLRDDYNIKLSASQKSAELLLHEKNDKGIFRKIKIEELRVNRLGQGGQADVSAGIRKPGSSECERLCFTLPGGEKGKAHILPDRHLKGWEIEGMLSKTLGVNPNEYDILPNDWACLYHESGKVDVHAYAVATPFGKQYMAIAAYKKDFDWDFECYLSEPADDGQVRDLIFYAQDRRPFDVEKIIEVAEERRIKEEEKMLNEKEIKSRAQKHYYENKLKSSQSKENGNDFKLR